MQGDNNQTTFSLWSYWDQVSSRSCVVFLDSQKQLWCVLISVAAGQWAGLHIADIFLLGYTASLMCVSAHVCVWCWMSGGSHGGGAENFKPLSSGWLLWALLRGILWSFIWTLSCTCNESDDTFHQVEHFTSICALFNWHFTQYFIFKLIVPIIKWLIEYFCTLNV